MRHPTETAPLNDPSYTPLHPPIDGTVPAVVAKWGPRSQLRWFDRFASQLKDQYEEEWSQFYCQSLLHKGLHCPSCVEEQWSGYADPFDPDYCCCRAPHGGAS